MTDRQQHPLWKVMQAAHWRIDLLHRHRGALRSSSPGCGYAAALRVIADRVVPDREFPDGKDDIQKGIWLANNRIRQHLMDEADRAEAGQ